MKKIILGAFVLLSNVAFSQIEGRWKAIDNETENEKSNDVDSTLQKKNSIDYNALSILWGVNIGYERVLNKEVGVGISSFILYKKTGNEGLNYYVSPYARYYFGKKPNTGFFIEGMTALMNKSYREREYKWDYTLPTKEVTTIALGGGFGGKWNFINSNLTLEIHMALAGVPYKVVDYNPFLLRMGVRVGYRF